jgi:hypothetical protein
MRRHPIYTSTVPLPYCRAIYLSHMPTLSPLLRSHEQCRSYEKVWRASQAFNQSEAHASLRLLDCYHRSSWPKLIQKCTSNASPQGYPLPPQLEHVNAEQKSLAVSRYGNSTDTRIGWSSCAESTCQQPYHWSKDTRDVFVENIRCRVGRVHG